MLSVLYTPISLFAQHPNIPNLSLPRMIFDIALGLLLSNPPHSSKLDFSIGEYHQVEEYLDSFRDKYLRSRSDGLDWWWREGRRDVLVPRWGIAEKLLCIRERLFNLQYGMMAESNQNLLELKDGWKYSME